MTRLRLNLNDGSQIDQSLIKRIPGVLGVVGTAEQLQIVLGPGKVQQVATEMQKLLSAEPMTPVIGYLTTDAKPR